MAQYNLLYAKVEDMTGKMVTANSVITETALAVLPHIGKILERIQLQLNQKDITLRPSQHGFIKDRSTTSALIAITQVTQPWFNATDSTCRDTAGIHALFIDFRKTFDLVDHGILLNKLAHMNVNKNF